MNRFAKVTLTSIALLGMAITIPLGAALAQQKQKVSYKVAAENTKYTQQLNIAVGDVAGHEIRISEIHRTFPTNAPMINGVRLKEIWSRNMTDWIDLNGPTNSYNQYVLESGDKFFTRTSTLGQNSGTGKRMNISTGMITGGTGKFAGIQGVVKALGTSDPKASLNETQVEIEYWFVQ